MFASDTSAGAELLGLFYGGGLKALGVQALGAVSLIAWAAIVGSILFVVLKKAGLLRAKPQEEIEGLDSTEHGLASAFSQCASILTEDSRFSNCCKGFIVNFDYVNTISGNDFLMQNGDYVPIKKRENQQVKKQYLTYELKDIIRE